MHEYECERQRAIGLTDAGGGEWQRNSPSKACIPDSYVLQIWDQSSWRIMLDRGTRSMT